MASMAVAWGGIFAVSFGTAFVMKCAEWIKYGMNQKNKRRSKA